MVAPHSLEEEEAEKPSGSEICKQKPSHALPLPRYIVCIKHKKQNLKTD